MIKRPENRNVISNVCIKVFIQDTCPLMIKKNATSFSSGNRFHDILREKNHTKANSVK